MKVQEMIDHIKLNYPEFIGSKSNNLHNILIMVSDFYSIGFNNGEREGYEKGYEEGLHDGCQECCRDQIYGTW